MNWRTGKTYNLSKPLWFNSLPSQQFQALLTLFSKSFSSFPHGTCFLSASNLYLALDENYHPLCIPLPKNVTFEKRTVHRGLHTTSGILTLTDALFQEASVCAAVGGIFPDHNSKLDSSDCHTELIPVHSPLLGESYLVSCPPLTYMLKFSRFASLTSCLVCVCVCESTLPDVFPSRA